MTSPATADEVWSILREVAERSRETDRKFQAISRQVGHLGNRLGDFVQEMVRPALVRLFRPRGLDVHEVHPNLAVELMGAVAAIVMMPPLPLESGNPIKN